MTDPLSIDRETVCSRCGRRLVTSGDGAWGECPRFHRSWRNFWLGGFHDSFDIKHPMLQGEWR